MECVKIDTKSIAPFNGNYITVQLSDTSTVKEVKEKVIKKLKPKQTDPKYYDLAIVIESGPDEPLECVHLWPDDKPLQRIKKYSDRRVHFCLSSSDRQKVKIYTGDVFSGQTYKTIEIYRETTCREAVCTLLRHQKHLNSESFILICIDGRQKEIELCSNTMLIDYLSPLSSIHLKSICSNGSHWNDEGDSCSQNTDSTSSGSLSSEFSEELMKEIICRFGSQQFTWISESVNV